MKYFLALLLVLTVGCKKDPYPNSGVITTIAPQTPAEVRPAISADIPDNVDFKEGSETSITLRAVVPSPGKPVITIEKLPVGANFDGEKFTLTWTPDYFAGNVSNDPTQKVRIYPVVVWIRSSEDEVQAVRKTLNLVVYDVPRAINVPSSASFNVTENEPASYTFSIDNPDYASGPFDVSLSDFPANSNLVKISSTDYRIDFTPDYQHVNVNRDRSCSGSGPCREYNSRILVLNPAGHKFEKKVTIKVIDKRVAPKAVAVDHIEQGLDVSFQVGGYDLNSEVTPTIEMTSITPTSGRFVIDMSQDTATYSSVARITWTDLPPALNGSTQIFNFKVCALDTNARSRNCVNKTVQIDIRVRERLAPVINRATWTIGDMKYLNFKQAVDYKVNIYDAQDRSAKTTVEIFPESIRSNVTWNRDVLSVRFDKTGIFQFNVTATSQYGVRSIEGFVVEVFPENRGTVLLLSDSSRDKEVQFYRKHFKGLEVVNPFLQELGTRLLSGRDTVVVGTSVLADPESKPMVQQAVNSIKNVVIASPMIKNLPDALYKQITDEFKIAVVARYLDIPGAPALKDMSFVTRYDFEVPKAPVYLTQSSSVESISPMIFSTGVDTNNCDDVLEIADALKLNRFKVGVICDRPGSGRLALLGTEWADLKSSEADDDKIPSKWLKTMMTGGLSFNEEF
jgi:hypothetical protein